MLHEMSTGRFVVGAMICGRTFRCISHHSSNSMCMNSYPMNRTENTEDDSKKSDKPQQRRHNYQRKWLGYGDRFGTIGRIGEDIQPVRLDFRTRRADTRHEACESDIDGNLNDDDMRVSKKLRRREMEENKVIPTISVPFSISAAKSAKWQQKKAILEEFEMTYGADKALARILIDCAKKEYRHYEGMRYPSTIIPLVSDHWKKSKYKNDWFVINRMISRRNNQSFDLKVAYSWDECIHLIDDAVLSNLRSLNYVRPTLIQTRSFNAFDVDQHLFLAGETGCGKTIAYAAPIIKKLLEMRRNGGRGKSLILAPTKILRAQIAGMIADLIKDTDLHLLELNVSTASSASFEECDLCVSMPVTATNILKQFPNVIMNYLVIDEAETLLDDSFVDEMTDLLSSIKIKFRQGTSADEDGTLIVFSSATCSKEMLTHAEDIVDSDLVMISTKQFQRLVPHIVQKFIRVHEVDKLKMLSELLENHMKTSKGQALIFCKSVKTCTYVAKNLQSNFPNISVIIGTMSSTELKHLKRDVNNEPQIFVASDIASRGLDMPLLRHVINYDFPSQMVDYINRSGRVGRASSKYSCKVTSFIRRPSEVDLVHSIERCARLGLPFSNITTSDRYSQQSSEMERDIEDA